MRAHPQSLHDRAKLLASSHPLQTVAEIIGVLPSQITRMKKRGWKAGTYAPMIRPIPNDFAIQARRLTNAELVKHYRASFETVGRWFKEKPVRRSLRGRGLKDKVLIGRETAPHRPASIARPERRRG